MSICMLTSAPPDIDRRPRRQGPLAPRRPCAARGRRRQTARRICPCPTRAAASRPALQLDCGRGQGRRAAHAPAPAAAHGRPGPIRCRRARPRHVRPGHLRRSQIGPQGRRASGFPFVVRARYCDVCGGAALQAASRRRSVRRSRPSLRRRSWPRRRRDCIPGLRRLPARARRAPAVHRSRETSRPSLPVPAHRRARRRTAARACGPRPRAMRQAQARAGGAGGAVRAAHKPPAKRPCTLRPALSLAAPCASGGLHECGIC